MRADFLQVGENHYFSPKRKTLRNVSALRRERLLRPDMLPSNLDEGINFHLQVPYTPTNDNTGTFHNFLKIAIIAAVAFIITLNIRVVIPDGY
ncbi:hypothetical protein B5G29_00155 [Akkermansia muciniphila]|nr:hypothetical protein B5G29_00155 [Akkermansia muciniphila]